MNGRVIFLSTVLAYILLCDAEEKMPMTNGIAVGRKLEIKHQTLDCYDQPQCKGSNMTVRFGRNVPDLKRYPYNFDNRIQSCKYNGIYVLYDGPEYNKGNLEVEILYFRVCYFKLYDTMFKVTIKYMFLIYFQGTMFGETWGDDVCADMDTFSNKASSIR